LLFHAASGREGITDTVYGNDSDGMDPSCLYHHHGRKQLADVHYIANVLNMEHVGEMAVESTGGRTDDASDECVQRNTAQ
jgi:hypothetical protein